MADLRLTEEEIRRGLPISHRNTIYKIDLLKLIKTGYPNLKLEPGLISMAVSTENGRASVSAHEKITVTIDEGDIKPSAGVDLTKATTKDARSVTVDYKVAGGAPVVALGFKVYRSKTKDVDPASALIGTESAKASDLAPGAHEVTLLKGKDLPPDPDRPYVVVVATANGRTSQAYFRKWRLATVAHGYAGRFEDDRFKTRAWSQKMANDLVAIDRFDEAFALDWIDDSVKAQPGMATLAGENLAKRIEAYRRIKSSQHPGDVVDVHLIGHSRGTVVTGEALKALSGKPQEGSYVSVTLLDIHPANKSSDSLLSHAPAGWLVNGGWIKPFDHDAMDPQVTLPSGAGIRSVEAFWQNTPPDSLVNTKEGLLVNLWGQNPHTGLLENSSGLFIDWTHLVKDDEDVKYHPIGHEEVHQYYQDHFVAKGLVK